MTSVIAGANLCVKRVGVVIGVVTTEETTEETIEEATVGIITTMVRTLIPGVVDHVGVTTGPTITNLVTGGEAVVGTEITMEGTGTIMGMGDTVGDTTEGGETVIRRQKNQKR